MEEVASYIDSLADNCEFGGPEAVDAGRAAPSAARSGKWTRIRGLVVSAICLGVLAAGGSVSPSAGGSGTHRRLGLPACEFLARTGWPCPSCGMTTSVSAMVHGKVALAWKAHPFGVVLSVAIFLSALAGAFEALTGRALLTRLRGGLWWPAGAIVGILAGWAGKLLAGAADGSLPLR